MAITQHPRLLSLISISTVVSLLSPADLSLMVGSVMGAKHGSPITTSHNTKPLLIHSTCQTVDWWIIGDRSTPVIRGNHIAYFTIDHFI